LAVRNVIDQMRGVGQIMGGPSNITASNRQAFANQLDRRLYFDGYLPDATTVKIRGP
jgi:uncharacterized protein YaiI (UPF0178 family)